MARSKTREVTLKEDNGSFTLFRKSDVSKTAYDFSSILALRQLLTNEKARILNTIKLKKPQSIYELAKLLKRNFKAVSDDLKHLERFGFIDFVEEKTKNRRRYRPILSVDTLTIHFRI
jgi:predicted transcriptional regulator